MLMKEVNEHVRVFTGQKSSLPHTVLKESDAETILNFISRKGKLRKTWGASSYATPDLGLTSGGIISIDRFQNRWLIQQQYKVAFESGENSAIIETVGSFNSQTSSDRNRTAYPFRAVKIRNRVYLTDGRSVKQFILPSAGFTQAFINLGMFPPGAGLNPASVNLISLSQAGSAGTLADATTYKYVVTFWDANREAESLPCGANVGQDGLFLGKTSYSITTTAVNRTITGDLSAIKTHGYDTDRVTHFIVYRATQADSTVFKRISANDGLVAISASSFTDADGTEGNLGQVLDETYSPPPTGSYYGMSNSTGTYNLDRDIGARFIEEFRDQVWLFGTKYSGSLFSNGETIQKSNGIIYASQVGNPENWSDTYKTVEGSDQEDTGIGKFRNTLFFFKTASAFHLDGTAASNYEVKQIDIERGIVAPGSLQNTPIGVIGLAADGFILFDSASPGRLISEEIFDEIGKINRDYLELINSAYDAKEGKYECDIPIGVNTTVSKKFIYDINLKCWDFVNARVGLSSKYGLSSKGEKVGLLGDKISNTVYDISDELENTNVGATIRGRWQSKHFDFGHPDKRKRLQSITIKAKAVLDMKLSIDIVPDFGQQETVSVEDFLPEPVTSTWAEDQSDSDALVWDQGNWAGDTVPVKFTILVQAVATNIQLVIRESESTENRAGFEIDEIILSANLLDSV